MLCSVIKDSNCNLDQHGSPASRLVCVIENGQGSLIYLRDTLVYCLFNISGILYSYTVLFFYVLDITQEQQS